MAYIKNGLKTGNKIEQKHMDNIDNTLATHDTDIEELKGKVSTKVEPVSAEDAVAVGETYTKAEVDKIVTLANANKQAINSVISALKTAGIMQNS